MQNYRYLLFDQDGTLTDSMPGITRCVQRALSHFDIEISDINILTPFIGPPLRDSFREFYGFSESKAEEAVAVYGEHYNAVGLFENSVYEGIPSLLSALKADGFRLFVATSKPTELAERILEYYDLRKWFDFVGGGESKGPRSEKAGVIDYVLTQNGITDHTKAVMIGDRKHDICGAQTIGIDSIGVLWGYGGKSELAASKATHIVEDSAGLYRVLTTQHVISHHGRGADYPTSLLP